MVDIHAHPGGSLAIGRRGENEARRVVFDLSAWRRHYGEGTVQLLHQRAGDESPYPCALTVEGDTAYWLIQSADVAKAGWGSAQLHYYVGDTLAKSTIWRTVTADAPGDPSETPPEPQQGWVDKMLADVVAATTAAQADQEENDEKSPAYIKNRTHFVEPNVEQECFPETHFTTSEVTGNDGKTCYLVPTPFPALTSPPVGSFGTVMFNGAEYYGQWKTFPGFEDEVYFGNASLYPYYDGDREDTGEPFFVSVMSPPGGGDVMAGAATQSAMEVSCSATFISDRVHTLDPKYIKDMYYSEEKETFGTGFDAWQSSLVAGSPVIYKVRVAGVDYHNVSPTSVGQGHAYYNLGDVLLHVDMTIKQIFVSEGGVSVDDIVFYRVETVYHKIPIEFIPDELWSSLDSKLSSKMSSNNPSGTGSFSMNRKSGTKVGPMSSTLGADNEASSYYSHAEGNNTTASGQYSHAEGRNTTASGRASHAEGENTVASLFCSHAEGNSTTATGAYSHAEGGNTTASGSYTHAEGYYTTASGGFAHAEGRNTTASGNSSHAEGQNTIASHRSAHVCGEYNVADPAKGDEYQRGTYVIIVGNGTSDSKRSNAHTLDWSGNAWFAGTVEGTGIILKSSTEGSSKRFFVTVDDTGALSAKEITET